MKNITLIMVLFCATQLVNAQETIPVSGGEAAGAGGTVSHTIGQLIYTNPTTAAGSLNQGIQHISAPENVLQAINKIPKEKLIMLDNLNNKIEGKIVKVYQEFENDIYKSLIEGYEKIVKYKKLVMVYPTKSVYPYPKRIVHGFRKFCIEKSLDFEVIDEIYEDMILKNGDLFITIVEDDLVSLVHQIRDNEFTIGKDIGVLSYNDTPLKDLLGISVISTDFNMMGATTAHMILNKEKGSVKNPFNFIDRASM